MATVKIGRVRFAFRGEYDPVATYEAQETVTYEGSSWAAIQNVPAGTVPSAANAVFWAKIAARGQDGVNGQDGAQGPQGIQGEQGPMGPEGPAGPSEWDGINNKPQTATRWPAFSEVTSPPETATRWPNWTEVVDKPTTFPVDPATLNIEKLVTVPTGTAPFNNAANTPRSFYNSGLCTTFVEGTAGWPVPFAKLLNIPSFSATQDGGAYQLLIPYSDTYSEGGKVRWRVGKFDNAGWSTWQVGVIPSDLESYLLKTGTAADSSKFAGKEVAAFLTDDSSLSTTAKLTTNGNPTIETVNGRSEGIEIFSASGDALLTFHAGGAYAFHLGLDRSKSKLVVGGWSMGATSYEIYHQGNPPPAAAPSAAQVGSAIAAMAWNAVGSYVMARAGGNYTVNTTVAGSGLVPCTTDASSGSSGSTVSGSALSGTWRCMGFNRSYSAQFGTSYAGTIWKRIS